MVKTLWNRWKTARDFRLAMAWMLAREDDKWLSDIGLNREEARSFLNRRRL